MSPCENTEGKGFFDIWRWWGVQHMMDTKPEEYKYLRMKERWPKCGGCQHVNKNMWFLQQNVYAMSRLLQPPPRLHPGSAPRLNAKDIFPVVVNASDPKSLPLRSSHVEDELWKMSGPTSPNILPEFMFKNSFREHVCSCAPSSKCVLSKSWKPL